MASRRLDRVRAFFDRADNHRAVTHVTALRARMVRELLAWPPPNAAGLRVLDVGAGDGSVTRDLARDVARLTWLDASHGMLEAARRGVSGELSGRIDVVEGTLEQYARVHDVVICVGLLAHVDCVDEAMAKLGKLTRAGGKLIVEITDRDAATAAPGRLVHRVREHFGSHYGYVLNETSLAEIDAIATRHHLVRVAVRRHWSTPPVVRRLAPRAWQAAFERWTLETPALAKHGASVLALYDKADGVGP